MNDTNFMSVALDLAKEALAEDDLPVGSVITLNGKIVGRGRRSPSLNLRLDHAEMLAMKEAFESHAHDADNMILYTTLEPCAMCFGTILNCRIKRVVYALEDPYGGATSWPKEIMSPRYKKKSPEVIPGILRDDAKVIFKKFFLSTKRSFWKDQSNPLVKLCIE